MTGNGVPLVSIILVNYNGADVVLDCLRSLAQFLHTIPHETIVVDNASQDGSPDLIAQQFPWVKLIRQGENRGFGAGNNAGAKVAQGNFLLLLNTDTCLTCDLLPPLVQAMADHPDVGIIGPKLLNLDGSLQLSTAWAISVMGEYKTLRQHKDYAQADRRSPLDAKFAHAHTVDVVVGAAFFIRKALFDTLNGFDETFFMYCEESDLCQRAQYLGWKVLYLPEVTVIHHRGYSTNKQSALMAIAYRRSQLYYYQKHRPLWEQMVLRLYLLLKFAVAGLRSSPSLHFQLIKLLLDFRHYPLNRHKTI